MFKSKIEVVVEKLQKGLCLFVFKKRNGEIRAALGTLNDAIIAKETGSVPNKSKTDLSSAKSSHIRYFDMEVKEWRSFNINNLVEKDGFETF